MKNEMKNAIEELNAASGEKIYSILTASAWEVRKHSVSRGFYFAEFIRSQDDAQTVAAEAFLTIKEDAEKAAAENMPLTTAAYRAAWKAAKRINAAEIRNAADSIEGSAEDGNRAEIILTDQGGGNPFEIVSAIDSIRRAAHDNIDIDIIKLLADGLSRAEAAQRLNMSRQAVEKRLAKIRRKLDSRT